MVDLTNSLVPFDVRLDVVRVSGLGQIEQVWTTAPSGGTCICDFSADSRQRLNQLLEKIRNGFADQIEGVFRTTECNGKRRVLFLRARRSSLGLPGTFVTLCSVDVTRLPSLILAM